MKRFAWIDTTPPQDAEQDLAQAFRVIGANPSGDGVDHVLRIHAPMPHTLEGHFGFYQGIMRDPGPLSRAEREIIGIVVSKANGCDY